MDNSLIEDADSVVPDARTRALKIPPHSIEAEQSVLGGLMLDNDAWLQVSERLTEGDFYRRDHNEIFRAIESLANDGKPYDVVTLAEWLQKNDALDSIGGLDYLANLVENTPSSAKESPRTLWRKPVWSMLPACPTTHRIGSTLCYD